MNIKKMSSATGDTTGAGTGGASSGANYADLLSKMEYGDNSTDTSKLNAIITANPKLFELPADAIDKYALNCSVSAPVNFLYLSTIRGGRKMNGEEMSDGANGEVIVGGANKMSGGSGCGCGMKGGSGCGNGMNGGNVMNGGCFTCKKGVKNITLIYSGIHIIIPKLYSKYHAAKTATRTAKTATRTARTASLAKKAKAAKKAKTA
jgi:hypothetical protein